jgi:aminopeptidase N
MPEAQSYLITQLDLELNLSLEYAAISTSFSYKLDHEHGEEKHNLVLHTKCAILIAIEINGVTLTKDKYSLSGNERSLTIFQAPAAGRVVLKTEVHNYSESTREDLNYFGLDKIIFFPQQLHSSLSLSTKITANLLQFPTLIANGNLEERGHCADGSHYTLWADSGIMADNFSVIAGKFSCIEDYYATHNSKRLVSLKVYALPQTIHSTQFAMEAIKKVIAWNEESFNIEPKAASYNLVIIPEAKPINICVGNLSVFDAQTIASSPNKTTDEGYIRIIQLIANNYMATHNSGKDAFENYMSDVGGLAETRISLLKEYTVRPAQNNIQAKDPEKLFKAYTSVGDPMHRWLNGQELFKLIIKSLFVAYKNGVTAEMPCYLIPGMLDIIKDKSLSYGCKAELLSLPTKHVLMKEYMPEDLEDFVLAYNDLEDCLAKLLATQWCELYYCVNSRIRNDFSPETMHKRRLKNLCLHYMMKTGETKAVVICAQQFYSSQSTSDKLYALELLCTNFNEENAEQIIEILRQIIAPKVIDDKKLIFYVFKQIAPILGLSSNDIFSLSCRLCQEHLSLLHDETGAGYKLLMSFVTYFDSKDSKQSCFLLNTLENWQELDTERQGLVRKYLQNMSLNLSISDDLQELVKSLLHSALDLELSFPSLMLSQYSTIASPRAFLDRTEVFDPQALLTFSLPSPVSQRTSPRAPHALVLRARDGS